GRYTRRANCCFVTVDSFSACRSRLLAFPMEPEGVALHNWTNGQRNGHLALLMLDDLQFWSEKAHELLAGPAFRPNRAPVEPMPLAEMPQDVIPFRCQPTQELLLVPAHVTSNERMQTAGIDNHIKLTGGGPSKQIRVDPGHLHAFRC